MYYLLIDYVIIIIIFFFFSSRRRHTRSLRDWSSDVCSSDLKTPSFNRQRVPKCRRTHPSTRPTPFVPCQFASIPRIKEARCHSSQTEDKCTKRQNVLAVKFLFRCQAFPV